MRKELQGERIGIMKASDQEHGAVLSGRLFFKALAMFWVVMAVPSALWAFFVSSLRTRTVEEERFLFDPSDGTIFWSNRTSGKELYWLMVEGLVEKPKRFSYKDLRSLLPLGFSNN